MKMRSSVPWGWGGVCPEARPPAHPQGPHNMQEWAQATGASDPSVIWGLTPPPDLSFPSVKSWAVASMHLNPKSPEPPPRGRGVGAEQRGEVLRWGGPPPPTLSALPLGS